MKSPPSLAKLIDLLGQLPGVGAKTAERLAFHLVHAKSSYTLSLASALRDVRERVQLCQQCHDFTEQKLCAICLSGKRNRQQLCIVERPVDVRIIEESGVYNGLYHVLHGSFSPLEGTEPESLKIESLEARFKANPVTEIILAMNNNVEGDATAHYLASRLKEMRGKKAAFKISRLAAGLPLGGSLTYADPESLSHALASRQEL